MSLEIGIEERQNIWEHTVALIEGHYQHPDQIRVTPKLERQKILETISNYNFESPKDPIEAISFVVENLKSYLVHTTHPRYLGLFNPRANFPSIIGDLITAAFNPQMAAWSHAPFCIDVESYMITELGKKFGYTNEIDGVFTSGGAEANLTAVITALNSKFPSYKKGGANSIDGEPKIYCSNEAHHSINKAASITGIGIDAVRAIPHTGNLNMDLSLLREAIDTDQKEGNIPFMVVATGGTTGGGGIDEIQEIRKIASEYNLWMHADCAYGGGVVLTKEYKHILIGVEAADSITFDAHKWLSVPMGAGIFLTNHANILSRSFGMETEYMPKEGKEFSPVDPFTHSIQWSRRFTGLKLYLALLIYGWEGYGKSISEDIETGIYFRNKLIENGWKMYNNTLLPICCFGLESKENSDTFIPDVVNAISKEGEMWVSVYPINNIKTIRACITNYLTRKEQVDTIVSHLNRHRDKFLNT